MECVLSGPPNEWQVPEGTTDVLLNGVDQAWIDGPTGLCPVVLGWTPEQGRDWVMQQLALARTSWDAKRPFVDAALAGGWRLHVVFPPASDRILVSLRRSMGPDGSPESRWGGAFRFLADAARSRATILIAGATGSGKTTLLNDLLGALDARERVLILEDTAELRPRHLHTISLAARAANADGFGEITVRELLKQSLRMRPDRIILGECRGGEVLDLMQTLNTGQRGAMGTIHANGTRDALRRVELLCALYGPTTLSHRTLTELLSSALNFVVFVEKRGSLRHISEIGKLEGIEEQTILLRPVELTRL